MADSPFYGFDGGDCYCAACQEAEARGEADAIEAEFAAEWAAEAALAVQP
jgi:hypothetical protein